VLERTVRLQPSFASAWYRLGTIYAREGKGGRAKRRECLEKFKRLERGKVGIKAGVKYGEGGKYNQAIRHTVPPGTVPPAVSAAAQAQAMVQPRFAKATMIASQLVERRRPDGRVQPPSFALGDIDDDDELEVVLCGTALEPDEPMIVIGSFVDEDVFSLDSEIRDDAVVCALGDLDGDGNVDLVTARESGIDVRRGDGKGGLRLVPMRGLDGVTGFPVRLLAVDVDSDWDVDIVCLVQSRDDDGEIVSRLHVFSNNQDGSFRDIAKEAGIDKHAFAASEMLWCDLDGDIDLDVMVIDGASGKPHLFANDRAWVFRRIDTPDLAAPGLVSARGGDFDGDGDEDVVLFCGDRLHLWRNGGGLRFAADADFAARHGTLGGTAGVFADFEGRLRAGLLVVDANMSARYLPSPGASSRAVDLPSFAASDQPIAVALAGTPRQPALLVADRKNGVRAWPLETASTWIALDLRGPGIDVAKRQMIRSNTTGIGASVEIRAGGRRSVWQLNTGSGGTAREPTRLRVGLDGRAAVDYARILWPDGVLQSELGLAAGRVHVIEEVERKPSSCPVLFVWDGDEMRFVADVLGVGGLGYFESPERYSSPDPTELLLLPKLAPRLDDSGREYFDLRLLEPLEECSYVDRASLLVVDHPLDVSICPLEMFAVRGPKPGFDLLAYRERARPRRVVDHRGDVVTEALARVDGVRAPRLEHDRRFPGVVRGVHAIEIDFEDEIGRLMKSGDATVSPFLLLFGHIEYGYSTSNFASWQTGFVPRAPSFSVERDGRWVALREEWGFPAGYPRWMAVDLAGQLRASDRRIRVETNLEIQWDEVVLAMAQRVSVDDDATKSGDRPSEMGVRVRQLDARRADLRHRGFPGDASINFVGEGRLDGDGAGFEGFAYRDFHAREPFRAMPGSFTRFGDVRELLESRDDRMAIFGPGEEIRLEFAADRLPELDDEQARSFVWKCVGYCKDLDLYTAHPDAVEPLPFAGMSGYPYSEGEHYPKDPALARYRSRWNTRVVRPQLRRAVYDDPVTSILRTAGEPVDE
jgi:hypothetical protein